MFDRTSAPRLALRPSSSKAASKHTAAAALAAAFVAACGGSGGGGAPPVALAFAISAVDLAENSGQHQFEVVLTTSTGALTSDATVTVSDIASGGATSGSDYTAFAPVVLTFPTGSVDGAAQSFTIDLLDDSDVEPPERITLELSAATGEPVVSSPTRFVIEIADDEPKASPFLFVTEDDGTLLASNQLFDLPDTNLGAESAPLRITVRNLGPSQFQWRPPVLAGVAAGEFQIELVEVDGVVLPEPLPVEALTPSAPPFLRASADLAAAGALVPDAQAMAALAGRRHVRISGFPWPRRGAVLEKEIELDLVAQGSPFANDATVLTDGGPLDLSVGHAANTLFTGTVVGEPHSKVFMAFSPHGSRGWIDLGPFAPRLHLIAEPHVDPTAAPCRLVFEDALPEGLRAFTRPLCSRSLHVPGAALVSTDSASDEPALASSPTPDIAAMPIPGWQPGTIRLALETDSSFRDLFLTDFAATTYVEQLVGSVGELFERHVQQEFEIVYLALYPGADPWTSPEMGGDVLDLLDEFRAVWAPVLGGTWPAEAELGHLLSGDNLGGGVAYVDVVGNDDFAFAVSADLTGAINWGTFTGAPNPLIWDYAVFAHELGHGFGSDHTHEYCPPIDRCYAGCETTTVCSTSTLMSYCHLCPQGLMAVEPSFHALTSNEMRRLLPTTIGTPTVGADVELVFEVRFTPYAATGSRTARIDFAHNASNLASPFRVRLQALAQ